MGDATIIYYTSNKENPAFEQKVRDNILKVSGGLPIISVSHKPIDFGENIVVGDVGASGFNMFRQVQIALEKCKTEFVISCEADCLYPPDYFTFRPERNDRCYRNSNLYVMAHKRPLLWKKEGGATHAQIIGREYYLNRLNKLFEGAPKWSVEEKNFPRERHHKVDIFDEIEHYQTKAPVLQLKTSDSMRHYTTSDRIDRLEIPYWGKAIDIRKKYL